MFEQIQQTEWQPTFAAVRACNPLTLAPPDIATILADQAARHPAIRADRATLRRYSFELIERARTPFALVNALDQPNPPAKLRPALRQCHTLGEFDVSAAAGILGNLTLRRPEAAELAALAPVLNELGLAVCQAGDLEGLDNWLTLGQDGGRASLHLQTELLCALARHPLAFAEVTSAMSVGQRAALVVKEPARTLDTLLRFGDDGELVASLVDDVLAHSDHPGRAATHLVDHARELLRPRPAASRRMAAMSAHLFSLVEGELEREPTGPLAS